MTRFWLASLSLIAAVCLSQAGANELEIFYKCRTHLENGKIFHDGISQYKQCLIDEAKARGYDDPMEAFRSAFQSKSNDILSDYSLSWPFPREQDKQEPRVAMAAEKEDQSDEATKSREHMIREASIKILLEAAREHENEILKNSATEIEVEAGNHGDAGADNHDDEIEVVREEKDIKEPVDESKPESGFLAKLNKIKAIAESKEGPLYNRLKLVVDFFTKKLTESSPGDYANVQRRMEFAVATWFTALQETGDLPKEMKKKWWDNIKQKA